MTVKVSGMNSSYSPVIDRHAGTNQIVVYSEIGFTLCRYLIQLKYIQMNHKTVQITNKAKCVTDTVLPLSYLGTTIRWLFLSRLIDLFRLNVLPIHN